MAECGIRPHRLAEVLRGSLAVGAVGQAREQRPTLATISAWKAPNAAGVKTARGDCRGAQRSWHPDGARRRVVPFDRAESAGACLIGFRAIVEALNARGIRTARGGPWHATKVRNLTTRTAA
ncbi:MAG TPA: recombinase family protein [Acetobacteraceae bacterium]|nr:recombinase family protein [Acetobacteraceae bacterium]